MVRRLDILVYIFVAPNEPERNAKATKAVEYVAPFRLVRADKPTWAQSRLDPASGRVGEPIQLNRLNRIGGSLHQFQEGPIEAALFMLCDPQCEGEADKRQEHAEGL
jgi:hypothetical protein